MIGTNSWSNYKSTEKTFITSHIICCENVLVMYCTVFSMAVAGCLHPVNSDRIADFTALDSFLQCEEDCEQDHARLSRPGLSTDTNILVWPTGI